MLSFKGFFLILIAVQLIKAGEEIQTQFQRPPSAAVSSTTTGFTVGKQYNLDAKVLTDGTASASLYGMLGGQVGRGPTYYTNPTPVGTETVNNSPGPFYYDSAAGSYGSTQALSQTSSSVWSPSNVNYYVAGGVCVAVLLGYGLYAFFTSPSWLKIGNDDADDDVVSGAPVANAAKKDSKPVSKKTRRRREIRRNEEATRLASIVLSAIESGECLENSICLMGSQIGGTQKGKLAGTVLRKLIPQRMQDNQYFLTLEEALIGGEDTCKRFNCRH